MLLSWSASRRSRVVQRRPANQASSCLADDDSPGPDGPGGDQAIADVGIALNETFNDGAIVAPPNKDRSIRRFGKRAGEDQVASAMGFPSER